MTEEPQKPVEASAEHNEEESRPIHGGRNLMILGLVATVIAIITTAVSLIVYRVTGDIYLDRSRPGYISEDEKDDKKYEAKESISTEGEVNKSTVDEYLNQLDSVRGRIDSLAKSFDPDPLDDDALAIYPHDENLDEE